MLQSINQQTISINDFYTVKNVQKKENNRENSRSRVTFLGVSSSSLSDFCFDSSFFDGQFSAFVLILIVANIQLAILFWGNQYFPKIRQMHSFLLNPYSRSHQDVLQLFSPCIKIHDQNNILNIVFKYLQEYAIVLCKCKFYFA